MCLTTLSTHGYEVMHSGTVEATARLLAEYLCRPVA
jgi:putative aminopeptidase FrvX